MTLEVETTANLCHHFGSRIEFNQFGNLAIEVGLLGGTANAGIEHNGLIVCFCCCPCPRVEVVTPLCTRGGADGFDESSLLPPPQGVQADLEIRTGFFRRDISRQCTLLITNAQHCTAIFALN